MRLLALLAGAAGMVAYRLAGAGMEMAVHWARGSDGQLAGFLCRRPFQVGLLAGLAAVTLGVLWQLRTTPRRSLRGNRVMAAVLVILAVLPIDFEIRSEPVPIQELPEPALPQPRGGCLFEFAVLPASPHQVSTGMAGYRWVPLGPQAELSDALPAPVRMALEQMKAAGGHVPLLMEPEPLCLESVAGVRQMPGADGSYRPYVELLPQDQDRMYELTRHAVNRRAALAEIYEGQVQAVLPVRDPLSHGIVIFGPLADPARSAEVLDP